MPYMKTCSVYIDSRTGLILDILSKHSRAFLPPIKGGHNAKQCKVLVSLTSMLLHSYAKNLYKYIKKGNKSILRANSNLKKIVLYLNLEDILNRKLLKGEREMSLQIIG